MIPRTTDNKTEQLVVTALMMSLILVGTIVLRIPIPMTQGYVHLGDAMIYLAVLSLGKRRGAVAAGLGSAMADVLGGYAFWAPWTFFIKFAMAYVAGIAAEKSVQAGRSGIIKSALPGMIAGGLVMTAGYFIAETVMYGSAAAALLGVPWNIGQFIAGIIISLIIYSGVGLANRSR